MTVNQLAGHLEAMRLQGHGEVDICITNEVDHINKEIIGVAIDEHTGNKFIAVIIH